MLGHEVQALHGPPHQPGPEETGHAPHQGAHQAMGGNIAQLHLEGDETHGRDESEGDAG